MDKRGSFTKTFHVDEFQKNELQVQFAEDYYSISNKDVLRGLHFQLPPHDHVKMVYCLTGEVMDAVVDLRVGSPAYGTYEIFQLSADKANILYIPKGLAHGFYVSKEPALVMYKASSVYSQDFDFGIRWDSLGIPWPSRNPIISERDSNFPPFHQFASPFSYQEE
ncbi:dTDP-4-dehydrorhamnose 3,5-epimerase [Brevibacillus choshinensis]|uniref:dTDP-4-dehydrorhamnose 3,5-epimerase n=2 Tax=Brevibacillus choshinensis TaxID=54911 RepID=A0ABR5NEV7_BRECH|nr:dTDP-4-dehydrorhamnose 3,5-epimerase [Brevibacillus choshinensis]